MAKDGKRLPPDTGPIDPTALEEHGHVGAVEEGQAFKNILGAPMAFKPFPSLASGYIYNCVGKVGTASGASTWRIFREDLVGGIDWADGDPKFNNACIDLSSLTYL